MNEIEKIKEAFKRSMRSVCKEEIYKLTNVRAMLIVFMAGWIEKMLDSESNIEETLEFYQTLDSEDALDSSWEWWTHDKN